MNARLLLISSDEAVVKAVRSAIDSAASLMVLENPPAESLGEKYVPNIILIDSDARNGVQTAFEKIEAVKRNFQETPVIALGNEMSAQLVLAALRAGADDFIDREAAPRQIQLAISTCLTRVPAFSYPSQTKIIGVLSALCSEQDQDFASNLAVRAAKRSPDGMTLYIDLSVPATHVGIALGIQPEFGVADAVREIARVDAALLESALARDPRCGLYVMPLCTGFDRQAPLLEAESFAALLHLLRSCCKTIIINYGPFSRERDLLEMASPSARFFVCCNPRFPSIKAASELIRWFSSNGFGVPDVVVHALAPGTAPSADDIRKALQIAQSFDLDASWEDLAQSVNSAKPLALQDNRYSRALDACLARIGIAPEPKPDFVAVLRDWLLPKVAARTS